MIKMRDQLFYDDDDDDDDDDDSAISGNRSLTGNASLPGRHRYADSRYLLMLGQGSSLKVSCVTGT